MVEKDTAALNPPPYCENVNGRYRLGLSFPDNCPVNIANPSDLKKLKTLFNGRPVYIVTGMDVIAHASAYQAPPVMDSIHHCNHIVFTRKTSKDKNALDENLLIAQNLYEDTIKLELGSELDDVSSSKIRENIDRGRDISNLIDPLCQRFIYEYGIYLREPQYKELQLTKAFVAEAEPLGEKLSENRYLFFGQCRGFCTQKRCRADDCPAQHGKRRSACRRRLS